MRSSPEAYTLAWGVSEGAKDAGRLMLDAFACENGMAVLIAYGELSYVKDRYSLGSETGTDCKDGIWRLRGCICELISIPL